MDEFTASIQELYETEHSVYKSSLDIIESQIANWLRNYPQEYSTEQELLFYILGLYKSRLHPETEERRFSGLVIGVTGSMPWNNFDLELGTILEEGCLGKSGIWQQNQIIVIGREDFDKEYLKQSVEIGLQFKFTCTYLSQEAFADLLLPNTAFTQTSFLKNSS